MTFRIVPKMVQWTILDEVRHCDNLLLENFMPTKNPRIHVVLEKPLFERLRKLAKCHGLSMSLEARELIRRALSGELPEGKRAHRGLHFESLIGAFRSKVKGTLDDSFADQVHG